MNANMFRLVNKITMTSDAVQVHCSSAIAQHLLDACEQCALFALQLGKQWFRIVTDIKKYDIPAAFAMMASDEETQFTAIASLQKISAFDLQEFYGRKEPSYLIAQPSQTLLACNYAALQVNQKTAQEYIGQSVMGLWDDDKLMTLMGYLQNAPNQLIPEYEFVGRRWRRDTMNGETLWRRDDWAFISRYQLVEFLGQPCRYGVTLQAEKVTKEVL